MTRTYKVWNDEHDRYIREHAHKITDKEIAKKLNRGLSSVRKRRQRLKIKKKSGRGICEVIQRTSLGTLLEPRVLTDKQSKQFNDTIGFLT